MKEYYCWKCKNNMPFLEENEWLEISPLLEKAKKTLINYRKKHDCDLKTARKECKPEVTQVFENITGISNVHFDIICHHRLKDWGQECPDCGYLLRTTKAKYCAKCGWFHNL